MYKPLQKLAPQKGFLKNISPGALFRNFTVPLSTVLTRISAAALIKPPKCGAYLGITVICNCNLRVYYI